MIRFRRWPKGWVQRHAGRGPEAYQDGIAPRPTAGLLVALLMLSGGGLYALLLRDRLAKARAWSMELERAHQASAGYRALVEGGRIRQEMLRRKEEALLALTREQALPVHLVQELVACLPREVWFKKLTQRGAQVTLEGEALDFESINTFFGNLQAHGRWFRKPVYPGAKRGPSGAFEFTLSFELQNGA